MEKIWTVLLVLLLALGITACKKGEDSSHPEPAVDLTDFTAVGYDFEPGDFKYQFELTKEQKAEFGAMMQPETWAAAAQEELPEYGLNCVLSAKSSTAFLYVTPWGEGNTAIIKIVPIDAAGDGSDSVFYFAPPEVGDAAAEFMSAFQ